MARFLLFLTVVLALVLTGGLFLRSRALPETASPANIERHLETELAILHEAAATLVAEDIRFPHFDHDAGYEDWEKALAQFHAETDRIEAMVPELEHPALRAARIVHHEGVGNRFEIWVQGEDQLSDVWSISPARPTLGQASVRRVHGGDFSMISYSAVGESQGASTPGIEILVDLDWLMEQ